MKAALFDQHGGPEALYIGERPTPDLPDDHILVRVRAVALNGFDPMMLEGSTGLKTPFPMIPCGDFAGTIAALGSNVNGDWEEGMAVSGYPILPDKGMMGEVTPGAACEFVAMPESCVVPVPDGVSHEEAAAMPVAYGTAYRMMTKRAGLKAGERVLILGATGGVGVAAMQLAKRAGCEVIACGTGAEKAATLKQHGADDVIDTAQDDVLTAIRSRYGKPAYTGDGDGGVDVLVNYIGGDTWVPGIKCVRKHGRILVCGATAGYDPKTDLRYIWSFEHSVIGSNGWSVEDQADILKLAAKDEYRPIIHCVRPLEEIGAAYQELIDRKVVGKSVLTL
ncbi:MAG: zinc-binding dehydrogenase [Pseudomonadota bacterium]